MLYNVNLLFLSDYPPMEMPSGNSLMELLDVIVLLYNLSSHDQLFKVSCFTLTSEYGFIKWKLNGVFFFWPLYFSV